MALLVFFAAACGDGAGGRSAARAAEGLFTGRVIASDPSVIRDGAGGYRMFYTDLDPASSRTYIAEARSDDGQTWRLVAGRGGVAGLVLSGRDGAWDENLESAAAVHDGDRLRVYFSGYRDTGHPTKGFPAALWLAEERDGRLERVRDAPVMEPTPGWYDNDAVYSPTILYEDGVYHMIYVGHAYTDTSRIDRGGVYLLYASSSDGLNWTKAPEPLFGPGRAGGWLRDGAAEPGLTRDPEGGYLLLVTGLEGEERTIGAARAGSPAGPYRFGPTPMLRPQDAPARAARQVLAPSILVEDDGSFRMWYLVALENDMLAVATRSGRMRELR